MCSGWTCVLSWSPLLALWVQNWKEEKKIHSFYYLILWPVWSHWEIFRLLKQTTWLVWNDNGKCSALLHKLLITITYVIVGLWVVPASIQADEICWPSIYVCFQYEALMNERYCKLGSTHLRAGITWLQWWWYQHFEHYIWTGGFAVPKKSLTHVGWLFHSFRSSSDLQLIYERALKYVYANVIKHTTF